MNNQTGNYYGIERGTSEELAFSGSCCALVVQGVVVDIIKREDKDTALDTISTYVVTIFEGKPVLMKSTPEGKEAFISAFEKNIQPGLGEFLLS